jgi:hypothetical protein
MSGKPVRKNFLKVILYPCCSKMAAATKLHDAPIREPLPPKQLPNAKAYTRGLSGSFKKNILQKNNQIEIKLKINFKNVKIYVCFFA